MMQGGRQDGFSQRQNACCHQPQAAPGDDDRRIGSYFRTILGLFNEPHSSLAMMTAMQLANSNETPEEKEKKLAGARQKGAPLFEFFF